MNRIDQIPATRRELIPDNFFLDGQNIPYSLAEGLLFAQGDFHLRQFAKALFNGVCDAWPACLAFAQALTQDRSLLKEGQVTARAV